MSRLAIENFDDAGAGFADDVGSGRQYLPVGPPLVGKVARVPVEVTSVRRCRYQGLFVPAAVRKAAQYAQVDALLVKRNS